MWQPCRLDRPDTILPVPAPFHQGIPFAVFGISQIPQQHLFTSVFFSGIIAHKFDHLPSPVSDCPAPWIVVAILILGTNFVFQGTPLIAICD